MSGSDTRDSDKDACERATHHELCCALGDFAFLKLQEKCGEDKAMQLSLVVAACLIGAYAHGMHESIDNVAEAVRLLARTFDAQVQAAESDRGEPS